MGTCDPTQRLRAYIALLTITLATATAASDFSVVPLPSEPTQVLAGDSTTAWVISDARVARIDTAGNSLVAIGPSSAGVSEIVDGALNAWLFGRDAQDSLVLLRLNASAAPTARYRLGTVAPWVTTAGLIYGTPSGSRDIRGERWRI
jgi:hypothetical protein